MMTSRHRVGKLTAAKRDKLPSHVFGLPKQEKYPMPDRSHAANAKARATQQLKKGNLSKGEYETINKKANRILYGTSKGKMNDNDRLNTYVRDR